MDIKKGTSISVGDIKKFQAGENQNEVLAIVYKSCERYLNYSKRQFIFRRYKDKDDILQELVVFVYKRLMVFDTSKETYSVHLDIRSGFSNILMNFFAKKREGEDSTQKVGEHDFILDGFNHAENPMNLLELKEQEHENRKIFFERIEEFSSILSLKEEIFFRQMIVAILQDFDHNSIDTNGIKRGYIKKLSEIRNETEKQIEKRVNRTFERLADFKQGEKPNNKKDLFELFFPNGDQPIQSKYAQKVIYKTLKELNEEEGVIFDLILKGKSLEKIEHITGIKRTTVNNRKSRIKKIILKKCEGF